MKKWNADRINRIIDSNRDFYEDTRTSIKIVAGSSFSDDLKERMIKNICDGYKLITDEKFVMRDD